MTGLGRMMAGGQLRDKVTPRDDHDFYPTPAECTLGLLHAEEQNIPTDVWEPCCGDGAIARILIRHGRQVTATDLIDRGYGTGGKDFLLAANRAAPAIITNPPFKLAAAIIHKALLLDVRYMALLLKSSFWHAAARAELFDAWQPARIHAMTWRPDFFSLGRPTMECMWCVWDRAAAPGTQYLLMNHPRVIHGLPLLRGTA